MTLTESTRRIWWSRLRPIRAQSTIELARKCDQHWRRIHLDINGTTIRGWACTEQEHCSSGCCTIISVKLHLDDPYLALALNDAYQRRNS